MNKEIGKLRKRLRDRRGFTLAELIVTVMLLTVVVYAAYLFLGFVQNTFANVTSTAQTQSEMKLIMDDIEQKVRTAKDVRVYSAASDASSLTGAFALCSLESASGIFSVNTSGSIKNYKPVPGLTVQFGRIGTTSKSLLYVKLTSGDGYTLEREIYAQNTQIIFNSMPGSALAIYPET